MMAKLLPATREGISTAGRLLRSGGLVAFPTETVYGLGANALDEAAVLRIFTTKGRPLTDPVIVHVPTTEKGAELLQLDDRARSLFTFLADRFWPGPLTLIARAHESLPMCVSASTGFVGVRRPAHPVAQRLLEEAGVPVAAPSANRFGHVSPTTPEHVMRDLGAHDVAVLESGDSAACDVGIESTVLRIDADASQLLVYRRGGVSERQLASALAEGGFHHISVSVVQRVVTDHKDAQQAPGQLITHYAPDVSTLLARPAVPAAAAAASAGAGVASEAHTTAGKLGTAPATEEPRFLVPDDSALDARELSPAPAAATALAAAIVVDFGGWLARQGLRSGCLAYRDLSPSGDVREASRCLFDTLRWAEREEGCKAILLADLSQLQDEHAAALADRMFRAASGRAGRVQGAPR